MDGISMYQEWINTQDENLSDDPKVRGYQCEWAMKGWEAGIKAHTEQGEAVEYIKRELPIMERQAKSLDRYEKRFVEGGIHFAKKVITQATRPTAQEPCLCDDCEIGCVTYSGKVTKCNGYIKSGTGKAAKEVAN